jgi:hypothetical protein
MEGAYARMRAAAAPVLSATQLERLGVLLDRDLARRETEARMNRIQSNLD